MVPKLPGHAFGNLWRNAIASIAEGNNKIELPDIVVQLRTATRKINEEYVRKLQGEDGLSQAIESLKESKWNGDQRAGWVLQVWQLGEISILPNWFWMGKAYVGMHQQCAY